MNSKVTIYIKRMDFSPKRFIHIYFIDGVYQFGENFLNLSGKQQ